MIIAKIVVALIIVFPIVCVWCGAALLMYQQGFTKEEARELSRVSTHGLLILGDVEKAPSTMDALMALDRLENFVRTTDIPLGIHKLIQFKLKVVGTKKPELKDTCVQVKNISVCRCREVSLFTRVRVAVYRCHVGAVSTMGNVMSGSKKDVR